MARAPRLSLCAPTPCPEPALSRQHDRVAAAPRPLRFTREISHNALGSVLVEAGRTKLLVTVTAQEQVPHWMSGRGRGWLTAEYSMLPGSTHARKQRDARGGRIDARSLEIQRLIGRALRSVVDLEALPEWSFWVDCDVLAADGGTRTAAINGAWVALHDAVRAVEKRGKLRGWPLRSTVSAISVGLVDDELLVDLDYGEDSRADVDCNLVFDGDGMLLEVQGTAEGRPFSGAELQGMVELASAACRDIAAVQREAADA